MSSLLVLDTGNQAVREVNICAGTEHPLFRFPGCGDGLGNRLRLAPAHLDLLFRHPKSDFLVLNRVPDRFGPRVGFFRVDARQVLIDMTEADEDLAAVGTADVNVQVSFVTALALENESYRFFISPTDHDINHRHGRELLHFHRAILLRCFVIGHKFR